MESSHLIHPFVQSILVLDAKLSEQAVLCVCVCFIFNYPQMCFLDKKITTPHDKPPRQHPPDVGQEGEGEEKSGHETADVRKVVDPGEQTEGEEEGGDGQQFGKGSPRPLQDGPALKELHEQAGEDAELAARRTHLR